MNHNDDVRRIVDRHAHMVEAIVAEISPLLRLPPGIERFDLEHAGYDGLIALAVRVGDGPGFEEVAKWAIRSAIIDYVAASTGAD